MVQWDMAAVIVAMISVSLMLSPATLSILRAAHRLVLLCLRPTSGRCERLEWSDIPEGVLAECETNCPRSGSWATPHDNCWNSSIGSTFPKAWTSAARREKWVRKPKQLDPTKKYIRTDVRTLKAYLLMNRYKGTTWDSKTGKSVDQGPTIQFSDVNGVLTAHLYCHPRRHHCGRTKLEVERILNGYPQQYQEFISVSQVSMQGTRKITHPPMPAKSVLIPSPIREVEDVYRGGWIIGVGLDVRGIRLSTLWYPPVSTIGHVLEAETMALHGHTVKYLNPEYRAISRVRLVLSRLLEEFPDEGAIVWTLQFMDVFFKSYYKDKEYPGLQNVNHGPTSSADVEQLATGCPVPPHIHSFWEWYIHNSQLFPGGATFYDRSYGAMLKAEEWVRVMQLFNMAQPLAEKDVILLRGRLLPVLRAVARGVYDVLGRPAMIRDRLPEMPELNGKKYIYLHECTGEEE
ncbi:hypothetical protein K469DRAFT_715221 [Zopfia rhizophila CBS 207.26]|uniref:Uncharacterized protein n=1 Tax=Zopfia rhizophila CBS 207.26 TaxID=1314779 RepID=A0A6A6ENN3_9PEZI|nr:hypothetical protein K469DRAFT_715221 [Zopfia rhizophila CBS 207.26]